MNPKCTRNEEEESVAGRPSAGKRPRISTPGVDEHAAKRSMVRAGENPRYPAVAASLPPEPIASAEPAAGRNPLRTERQTTPGRKRLNTALDPSQLSTKQSRARSVANEGQECPPGCEIKPAACTTQTPRKKTAPSLPLEGPTAAPHIEEALLNHLRLALVHHEVNVTGNTVDFDIQSNAKTTTSASDRLAQCREEEASVEDNIHESDNAATPANSNAEDLSPESSDAAGVNIRAALPCVQYFIISECARVARVVREEGGKGYGDEPATRAAELLSFLLGLLDKHDTFSVLLALACPSCRAAGMCYSAASPLMEYMVLSQRASAEELRAMDQKRLIERLGLLDGCRSVTGQTLRVVECCPFGEAHVALYLLLCSSSEKQNCSRLPGLRWQHVPFELLSFPAIVNAAKRLGAAVDRHVASRIRDVIREQYNAANLRRWKAPAMEKRVRPPQFTAAQRALIRPKAGCLTWAEELLRAILPETAAQPWHRTTEELQSRIRRFYAYTCADVSHGGFFTATLESTPAMWISPANVKLVTSTNDLVYARMLFAHMKVCQHVAEAVQRGGRCSCSSRCDAAVLFAEAHNPLFSEMRHWRDASHLLVNGDVVTPSKATGAVVDVDAVQDTTTAPGVAAAQSSHEAASFYAAGSFARLQAVLELAGSMSAAQVVDYVAQVTAESAEALPTAQVPRQYITAELKRHQLENVQWMWSKECEGYREHVSVPLYNVSSGAAPAARRVGVMYYCAATNEMIISRGRGSCAAAGWEAEVHAWNVAGGRIRGGLLCDDVGLGKTLSILTLCAYDRAVREAGDGDEEEAAAMDEEAVLVAQKYWRVSNHGPWGEHTVNFNRALLHWAIGSFPARTVPHPITPMRLPRTTLVVVPLSIAVQWIEEIRKFYPAASYILFYGAKRWQYTVDDMRLADIVITTYETLSMHLRQEANWVYFWLRRAISEADDVVCARARTQGWPSLTPPELFAAVHRYASDVAWPKSSKGGPVCTSPHVALVVTQTKNSAKGPTSAPSEGPCNPGSTQGGSKPGSPFCEPTAATIPTTAGTWTIHLDAAKCQLAFRCPSVSVLLPLGNSVESGTAEAFDYHTCLPENSAVSDTFIDSVWDMLKDYSARSPHTYSAWEGFFEGVQLFKNPSTIKLLVRLYHDAELCPPPESVRRELVRRVLLPPLWRILPPYWDQMKAHYTEVGAAEGSTRPALRITDLIFRRIVLDESQKCGSTSLLYLLSGERRWAVTGTPLNNGKTESLGFALHFLRMHSGARLLTRYPFSQDYLAYSYLNSHRVSTYNTTNSPLVYALNQALRHLWVRRRFDTPLLQEAGEVRFCVCTSCMQRHLYNISEGSDMSIPCEYRLWAPPRNIRTGLPCLPSSLYEVLALTMVRHVRNQQVNRELQLAPARHQTHYAHLTADEMLLYDRVASVIMNVAARMHRQGVLSSHMAYVMQWVQELCRLCLHPSRLGHYTLLCEDIEAYLLRGIFPTSNGAAQGDDIKEVLADSFVASTPQEALEWANSIAATHSTDPFSHPSVPEETVATLADLAQAPPLLPQCSVCMDYMAEPTLLRCLHMFCKECVICIINASRSMAGNINAKCPYCRNCKSMLGEKRVVEVKAAAPVKAAAAGVEHGGDCSTAATAYSDNNVDAVLARIGDGSRVGALVGVVEEIWRTQPDDGILVFSKYPAFLQLAHDAVAAQGYAPHMVCGVSSLAKRQRVMQAMQPASGDSALLQHRILFVTSRSANAGLNLTFANHVIFLEPNLNPALEQQAVGRVNRFGQLKQVIVHHLLAPHTIEEIIYRRTSQLREQVAQEPQVPASATQLVTGATGTDAPHRRTQFGRIPPAEALLLLEYPVPPMAM